MSSPSQTFLENNVAPAPSENPCGIKLKHAPPTALLLLARDQRHRECTLEYGRSPGIQTIFGSLRTAVLLRTPDDGWQHAQIASFHTDVRRAFHAHAGVLEGSYLGPARRFRPVRRVAAGTSRIDAQNGRDLQIGRAHV